MRATIRAGTRPGPDVPVGAPAGAAARRARGPARRRRAALAGVALAVALGLASCTSSVPEPRPEPTVTEPSPSPDPVPDAWPLTGIVADVVDRPAMSVKIENSAFARPQSGLEDADVVWEEMVEGGITRFNAVYHSAVPDELGPIRSVRPMDAAISGPLGGLMVISGGQDEFVSGVRDAGLQLVVDDDGAPGFYRSPERRSPHNLYGTGAAFLAQADVSHSAAPPPQLVFAESPATASAVVRGVAATAVDLGFPSAAPGWAWQADADAGRGSGPGSWAREERGVRQIAADGEPLLATNVVVLRVEVVITGAVDPVGNPVPETLLVGEGAALVATGGHVIEGTWSKAGELEPVVLTDVDGRTVELAAGSTWIELVPAVGGSVTYR